MGIDNHCALCYCADNKWREDMSANQIVQPGQRVITTAGVVRVVAFARNGIVFVYGSRGLPEPANVRYDALGGEAGTSNECDLLAA